MSIKDYTLTASDWLTTSIRNVGITTWSTLLPYIQNIPYGRNASRTDFIEVITNNRGTCSSKHALLKSVAQSNHIPHVRLLLGMYRMTAANTPGIGDHLTQNDLTYIPEAHCYLSIQGKRLDLTSHDADIRRICKDILEEVEIKPGQVGQFKVDYHKAYIQKWKVDNANHHSFESLWDIREACIRSLANSK